MPWPVADSYILHNLHSVSISTLNTVCLHSCTKPNHQSPSGLPPRETDLRSCSVILCLCLFIPSKADLISFFLFVFTLFLSFTYSFYFFSVLANLFKSVTCWILCHCKIWICSQFLAHVWLRQSYWTKFFLEQTEWRHLYLLDTHSHPYHGFSLLFLH